MMPATTLDEIILRPALRLMTIIDGRNYNTPEARKLLVAIAVQESAIAHRRQIRGPARGFWQFERIACDEFVRRVPAFARDLCRELALPTTGADIYQAIELNDTLAAAVARMTLWFDPRRLPEREDIEGGWNYYIRNWRPGKPHRERWSRAWQIADMTVFPEFSAG